MMFVPPNNHVSCDRAAGPIQAPRTPRAQPRTGCGRVVCRLRVRWSGSADAPPTLPWTSRPRLLGLAFGERVLVRSSTLGTVLADGRGDVSMESVASPGTVVFEYYPFLRAAASYVQANLAGDLSLAAVAR